VSTTRARPPAAAASAPGVRTARLGLIVGLAVAPVGLAALRLIWLSRDWPLVHDAPLMHYVAWRIQEGAAPYRDLFDMNFPGVYVAHLLLLDTLGPGDRAFRAFDLGLLLAVVAGLWRALRFSGAQGGLAAGTFFALYHVAGGPWLAGQRELLLCTFLAWGAASVVASTEAAAGARAAWLGGAGLALGAAVWIKPHAVVLIPALAAWAWLATHGPARGRALAAAAAGVALPGLATVVWLGWTGGLGPFADITLGYLIPLYSRLGRSDLLHELAVRDYGAPVLLGLAAWTGLGVAALARGRRWRALGVLVTGLAYGAVHFWVQGRGWEYHFYPAALFATALGAAGLGVASADGRRALTVALMLALGVTAGALWTKGQRNLAPAWIAAKLARVDRLSAALRPLVAAGGTVQVLDTTEGGIHALLRLRAREPSRFLYDFHFYHHVSHPYVRRLRAELMGALRARPPSAVVVFETGWPDGGYGRLAGFPELQRWLLDGYRVAEEGDGYRLYVARAGAR
jgi:hypothetical protein